MDLRVKDVERIVVQVPYRDRARPWLEIMVAEWAIVELWGTEKQFFIIPGNQ
jgi:hypothetical protein